MPSTRTLILPSGNFRLWTMLATVPTLKISSGLGSSTEASCWVARKIFLSPARASSSARTEASRPTMNGVIICGKMTMSRTGIIGTRFNSVFSRLNMFSLVRLACFLEQVPVDFPAAHHLGGDHELPDLALRRQVVHQLEHQVFQDHAQPAGAYLSLQGQVGDGFQRFIGESQPHIFELEQSLVLTDQGVLRLGQDAHQRALVQVGQYPHDRQAADELWDQAVADQIGGLHLLEQLDVAAVRGRWLSVSVEAQRLLPGAPLDDLFQPDKRAAADEQDIGRVHGREFLVRVLAAALRGHVGDGALDDLQQGLLHTLARDVPGDRGVLILLGNLVNLVDIDDALLGLGDIAVGVLEQLQDDVLDVLADVARFGQGRGVHNGEGHLEHARERLRQQRLAGTGGPDQQDVGLGQLHVTRLAVQENPLVVVVDGHGQFLFRLVLTDDVALQESLDLWRPRKAAVGWVSLLALFVLEDLLADGDALIADVGARIVRRRADQLLDLLLRLVAERAAQRFVGIKFSHQSAGLRRHPLVENSAGGVAPIIVVRFLPSSVAAPSGY